VLAQRVLNGGCDVNPSFVVVLNDTVTRRPGATLELSPGDEVYLLAAVAGG
jgi:molybdopterin converting factor small subunit